MHIFFGIRSFLGLFLGSKVNVLVDSKSYPNKHQNFDVSFCFFTIINISVAIAQNHFARTFWRFLNDSNQLWIACNHFLFLFDFYIVTFSHRCDVAHLLAKLHSKVPMMSSSIIAIATGCVRLRCFLSYIHSLSNQSTQSTMSAENAVEFPC